MEEVQVTVHGTFVIPDNYDLNKVADHIKAKGFIPVPGSRFLGYKGVIKIEQVLVVAPDGRDAQAG